MGDVLRRRLFGLKADPRHDGSDRLGKLRRRRSGKVQVAVEACGDDTQQQPSARGRGNFRFAGFDQPVGGQVTQAQQVFVEIFQEVDVVPILQRRDVDLASTH